MLLERRGDADYVTRAWEGKTVVCIATGPSLTLAQLELVRRAREAETVRVIAINDAYLVAPFADVLYAADAGSHKWWGWHRAGIAQSWPWCRFSAEEQKAALAAFKGQKCTIRDRIDPSIFTLKIIGDGLLSTDPRGLQTGCNGGHQAVNLAFLSGGSPILLLAYDAKRGQRGEKHGFGEHPDKSEAPYKEMVANLKTAASTLNAAGVRVFNCTPGSAVSAFPMRSLEECLTLSA